MFEQLKNLKKAQEMQRIFEKEKHSVKSGGIEITVNGNLRIENILIDDSVEKEQIGSLLKDLINKAFQEIQQKLARKVLQ